MPSRQDQLHSYQYSQQRVVAALVTHDPDPHRSPLRRAGMTAMVSLVVAALALTAVAIYGLLTNSGGGKVDNKSTVYLEKGTGAAFVYLDSDRRLHPVLNYTSGLLIADATAPTVKNMSRKALAQVQLGDPLGIPGAPHTLPDDDALRTDAWSVCTRTAGQGAKPTTTVLVGDKLTDGVDLTTQGLLVIDPTNRVSLILGNRRFPIPVGDEQETLTALVYAGRIPARVSAGWINAIPQGPDLAPPPIPDTGDDSDAIPDASIGDIITDGAQFAVVLDDGKAPITPLQAKLLQLRNPRTIEVTSLVQGANSAQKIIDDRVDGLPDTVPPLATAQLDRACVTTLGRTPRPNERATVIRLNPNPPEGTPISAAGNVAGGVLADRVQVQRGSGAVVTAVASPGAPAGSGTVSIVTDTGVQYPLAGRELLGKLGYGKVTPVPVPAQMLALLPQGPALDATKARQAVPGGA